MKKLENGFKALLKTKEVDHLAVWEESRSKLEGDAVFDSITLESERIRIFKVGLFFPLLQMLSFQLSQVLSPIRLLTGVSKRYGRVLWPPSFQIKKE